MLSPGTDFGPADFAAAWSLVEQECEGIGADDLEQICALGSGIARKAAASADERTAAPLAARAFLVGFLLGRALTRRAGGDLVLEIGDGLPAAIELVHARGRTAVIAHWCDLSAVAASERVLALSLLATTAPARDEGLAGRVERCFESGLAVALALVPNAVGDRFQAS